MRSGGRCGRPPNDLLRQREPEDAEVLRLDDPPRRAHGVRALERRELLVHPDGPLPDGSGALVRQGQFLGSHPTDFVSAVEIGTDGRVLAVAGHTLDCYARLLGPRTASYELPAESDEYAAWVVFSGPTGSARSSRGTRVPSGRRRSG